MRSILVLLEDIVRLEFGAGDLAKVRAIIDALLPARSMDEVFICGPEAMIEVVEQTLVGAGVPESRVHSERFASSAAQAADSKADVPSTTKTSPTASSAASSCR